MVPFAAGDVDEDGPTARVPPMTVSEGDCGRPLTTRLPLLMGGCFPDAGGTGTDVSTVDGAAAGAVGEISKWSVTAAAPQAM